MSQVYLVPGFFGFIELGSYSYFNRISEVLGEALKKHSVDAEIIAVDTVPTGSIRRRAAHLLEVVERNGGLVQDHLHFVGHSTGGLDIRMLLTPGVRLKTTHEEVDIADRTRSAITLSTPHYGTPLANFFTDINGKSLLYVLALLATSLPGRYSIYLTARLLNSFARLDSLIGQEENILDNMADNVLRRIKPTKGDEIWQFLREVSRDQGGMVQMTAECMDIFNAAAHDQPGVDYVCFVSAAPPPKLRFLMLRPRNIYQSASHALYAIAYTIASRERRQYPYPAPSDALLREMRKSLPFDLGPETSDGIVPSFSQLWGRFGGIVLGDHLDVVGQFQHRERGKVYTAWLQSEAGFCEERFRGLWSDIAAVIARAQFDKKK